MTITKLQEIQSHAALAVTALQNAGPRAKEVWAELTGPRWSEKSVTGQRRQLPRLDAAQLQERGLVEGTKLAQAPLQPAANALALATAEMEKISTSVREHADLELVDVEAAAKALDRDPATEVALVQVIANELAGLEPIHAEQRVSSAVSAFQDAHSRLLNEQTDANRAAHAEARLAAAKTLLAVRMSPSSVGAGINGSVPRDPGKPMQTELLRRQFRFAVDMDASAKVRGIVDAIRPIAALSAVSQAIVNERLVVPVEVQSRMKDAALTATRLTTVRDYVPSDEMPAATSAARPARILTAEDFAAAMQPQGDKS